MENDEFLSYIQAIRTFDIEPQYGIHQPKQKGQLGFTDLLVPTGRKVFYQVLDLLYRYVG
ncbi:hypothetical protein PB01_17080 [Psychrobacillus glaciei]|uniref:Uncharacterized protein n=1 Tax=Psychrobacillus glaciei TaxID=2283160 RepID=A0A5J6SVP9_9BACI|nr:hypothetical protein [Psychrobacillus glaciei]QFG00378.1 hypothetical protein PB01_17080 [Psychrobacillus glaciei]